MRSFGRPLALMLALLVLSIAFILGGASLALAGDDAPATTRLTLAAPAQVAFGSPATLEATLQDGTGQPVGKASIRFFSPASFLSDASGLMSIGQAITNERGIAVMEYISRRNGDVQVLAEFQGDARYGPSQGVATILFEGNHQLYSAEAGIRVPYVGKWVLVAVLSAIWSTYVFVVVTVLRIALAPPE